MAKQPPYGWKDLLTDVAIISVVVGVILFTVGSFPGFFGKFLPFLKQMRWPPNKAWTSAGKREGYRHFEVKQYGGKKEERWVELYAVNNKDTCIRVLMRELQTKDWTSGWLQLANDEGCSGEAQVLIKENL